MRRKRHQSLNTFHVGPSTVCQYLECRGQGQPAPHLSWWTLETVEGEEVLLEVDEDRVETRALELDTEAGMWTARERFYIGDTEHMACVASDRRGDTQVSFIRNHENNES